MRRIWPAPQVVWPARPQPWRATPAPVRPDPRAALCPILLKPLRIPESLLGPRFLIRLKRRGARECVHDPPQHLPDLRFLFLFKPLRVRRPFPRDPDRQVQFVLTDVPAGRARARALRVPHSTLQTTRRPAGPLETVHLPQSDCLVCSSQCANSSGPPPTPTSRAVCVRSGRALWSCCRGRPAAAPPRWVGPTPWAWRFLSFTRPNGSNVSGAASSIPGT
jgi:hypothetical protein